MPDIQVLWSDDDLIVVNKPSGLRVIPDGYDPTLPTLVGQLQSGWGKLFPVHRLDKDTSGVLILARNSAAHRNLDRQFANRQVHKKYLAVVIGVPEWDEKMIRSPLLINGDRKHRTVVSQDRGKPAETRVRVLRQIRFLSLLEISPVTGYTHQIRAHLSSAGFPLLGDALYRYPPDWAGKRTDLKDLPPFSRPALHAHQITFLHPALAHEVTFIADLPEDFLEILRRSQ